jgi:DNA-binding transcriptional LysR family regulator
MELRQLKTFRAVARTLSFTRAAAELGYVQSSVTAQVQGLERELGVPLFDRLGKSVVLTEAGRRLVGYAERMVELAGEAEAAVSEGGEPSGVVNVSAPETLCTYRLPEVLQELSRRFPEVRVVFHTSPTGALDGEVRRALGEGDADVALVLEEPLKSAELVVEPLIEEGLVVVASPEHPLAQRQGVGAGDLAGEPLLLTERGCGYRARLERSLVKAGVGIEGAVEFTSGEAIKPCVAAGMGVAVLAGVSVGKEIEAGTLAALPWREPGFAVTTQMVRHKGRWVSPAVEAFLSVTREVLGESQHS